MDREFISVSIYHIMMKKNETIHSGHEAIDNVPFSFTAMCFGISGQIEADGAKMHFACCGGPSAVHEGI